MADVITCPSGLQGRVRGMKVREERVLADRRLAKNGGQIDELLAACWEETLDPGPYAVPEGAKLDLGKVLQGDRFFALLMVRALTYGPEYAFGVSCRNDNCRARIEWELDLTKLPVRTLSEESRAAFVGGNRFETTLPDAGKKVAFKLLTGDDERKLPALQRSAPDKLLSAVLAYRVLEIDGIDAKAKRQFLEDLTMRDADFLVDEFDRVDCGVDTTIEIECPECFQTQEVELPFDKGFFLPGKDRTARRKAGAALPRREHGGVARSALPALLATARRLGPRGDATRRAGDADDGSRLAHRAHRQPAHSRGEGAGEGRA